MRWILRTAVLAVALGAAAWPSGEALAAPVAPPGYAMVSSGPIDIPPSSTNLAVTVGCPVGTVPWGGGASTTFIPNFGENIGSTGPAGGAWRARYNNSGTSQNDDFEVLGICARKPTGYSVRSRRVDLPAHAQALATASCPTGTVLLGGGTSSTATTSDSMLLSAWPKSTTAFRAIMWNGSAQDQSLTAIAICGARPPGYALVRHSASDMGGGMSVVLTGAQCPAGTSITGGGVHVLVPGPDVTIGSSFGDPKVGWRVDLLSTRLAAETSVTSAICAA